MLSFNIKTIVFKFPTKVLSGRLVFDCETLYSTNMLGYMCKEDNTLLSEQELRLSSLEAKYWQ